MEQSTPTLRSLLIPLQEGQAVLPNNTVAEVLPFSTPVAMTDAPAWVLGKLVWRAQLVPLVSLECLAFDMPPEPGSRSRIIVVKAIDNDAGMPHFAILAAGAPRLMNLMRRAITPIDTRGTAIPGVSSRLRIGDLVVIVPDMEAVTAELVRMVN